MHWVGESMNNDTRYVILFELTYINLVYQNRLWFMNKKQECHKMPTDFLVCEWNRQCFMILGFMFPVLFWNIDSPCDVCPALILSTCVQSPAAVFSAAFRSCILSWVLWVYICVFSVLCLVFSVFLVWFSFFVPCFLSPYDSWLLPLFSYLFVPHFVLLFSPLLALFN